MFDTTLRIGLVALLVYACARIVLVGVVVMMGPIVIIVTSLAISLYSLISNV
ncbi:hypothetical protein AB4Y85_18300 [Microvirga sp. 2YAF29]|uniref:hypothetical protein n=1 Tax=Microvirga sp. 2YAF29 TaxID=3233031 RepID=UPI003F9A8E60